jgi:hypothetical protein
MEGVIVRRIGNAPPPAGIANNPADRRDKTRKRRRG